MNLPVKHPITVMYSGNRGNGQPYLLLDGTWDTTVLDQLARFDVIITDVSPWTDHGIDLHAQLRSRNPAIVLIGWAPGLATWLNPNPAKGPKERDFPWNYWHAVESVDGWIRYRETGARWQAAHLPGSQGHPDLRRAHVRAALVGVIVKMIAQAGWDGVFLDMLCSRIGWMAPPQPYDESEWEAGHAAFLYELRVACPYGFLIVGNCGPGPTHPTARHSVNGWMRENFPLQNGGNWHSNMFGFAGNPGYLTHGLRNPGLSLLATKAIDGTPAAQERKATFGVCSALLGGGAAVYAGTPTFDPLRGFRPDWFPIYDGWGMGRGWLGRSTNKAYEWRGLWIRDFEGGTVLVNPGASPVSALGLTVQAASGAVIPR